MLSKLAVQRLTTLADYLAGLPAKANKHFYMATWFSHRGEHEIHDPAESLRKFDCGTVACAAGWAATIPAFNRAGLTLEKNRGDMAVMYEGIASVDSFDGLAQFFSIDDDDAFHLFGGDDGIKTPKQWARHCRKFIKANS